MRTKRVLETAGVTACRRHSSPSPSPSYPSPSSVTFVLSLSCLLLSTVLSLPSATSAARHVECEGTSNGVATLGSGSESRTYDKLVTQFGGGKQCTVVSGNLEITRVPSDKSLSFLSSIREVTGYLLIYKNKVAQISLDSLTIVRGKETLKTLPYGNYSLAVAENDNLSFLNMPNLKEISRGDIIVSYNRDLCYMDMVNWSDIYLPSAQLDSIQQFNWSEKAFTNNKDCGRLQCHQSCASKHCWGPGPESCQTLTRVDCDDSCNGHRCFGSSASQCCDEQCAGGCWGTESNQCELCQTFVDRGRCVEACPPLMRYNPMQSRMEPNPDVRYSWGFECIEKCPPDLLVEGNACVKHCGEGRYNVSGTCAACPTHFCPKVCSTEKDYTQMLEGTYDYSQLINCTLIEGSLAITDRSVGHWNNMTQAQREDKMRRFLKYFEAIEEITLSLAITDTPFQNLSFLHRLAKIGSRMKDDKPNLIIVNNNQLRHLGLISLKQLKHSRAKENPIALQHNSNLCYVNFEMFRNLTVDNEKMTNRTMFMPDYQHRLDICKREGRVCDEECVLMGEGGEGACWGPGPDMCYECRHFLLNNRTCVSQCDPASTFTLKDSTSNSHVQKCESCHTQCAGACSGRTPFDCEECVAFRRDSGECVSECLADEYPDTTSRQCRKCSSLCSKDPLTMGCTGPGEFVGQGGCNQCPGVTKFRNGTHVCSEPVREQSCGPDFFYDRVSAGMTGNKFAGSNICEECDEECDSCTGSGPTNCKNCIHFRNRDKCVLQCPRYMLAEEGECKSCHSSCNTNPTTEGKGKGSGDYPSAPCTGTSPFDCVECNSHFIHFDNQSRKCVDSCSGRAHSPYNLSFGSQCVSACPALSFLSDNRQRCEPCHRECNSGCTADLDTHCTQLNTSVPRCKHFETPSGKCVGQCPSEFQSSSNQGLCVIQTTKGATLIMVFVVVAAVALFILIALLSWCALRHVKKKGRKKQSHRTEYTMQDLADDCSEPSSPHSGLGGVAVEGQSQTEYARLKVIKREELVLANTIGTGAFGTVRRGVWLPANDKERQCPVAVKTLNDTSSIQQQNFIEEAKNMAMVRHACLVSVVAICLADEPLLITPLMLHGSIIDYMAKVQHITASTMLLWCRQIAEGMEYLQTVNIVHRDLAARNVLVESKQQVKISDFGLSKILTKGPTTTDGGKFATKWLAIESLTSSEFSHKTDVWSLGVTVWEILTHGEKPYADLQSHEVLHFLKAGGRLPQPEGCSLELYVVVMRCWLADPDARPTFTQLKDDFHKMRAASSSYLHDYNDPTGATTARSPSFEGGAVSEGDAGRKTVQIEEYLRQDSRLDDYQSKYDNCAQLSPNNTHPQHQHNPVYSFNNNNNPSHLNGHAPQLFMQQHNPTGSPNMSPSHFSPSQCQQFSFNPSSPTAIPINYTTLSGGGDSAQTTPQLQPLPLPSLFRQSSVGASANGPVFFSQNSQPKFLLQPAPPAHLHRMHSQPPLLPRTSALSSSSPGYTNLDNSSMIHWNEPRKAVGNHGYKNGGKLSPQSPPVVGSKDSAGKQTTYSSLNSRGAHRRKEKDKSSWYSRVFKGNAQGQQRNHTPSSTSRKTTSLYSKPTAPKHQRAKSEPAEAAFHFGHALPPSDCRLNGYHPHPQDIHAASPLLTRQFPTRSGPGMPKQIQPAMSSFGSPQKKMAPVNQMSPPPHHISNDTQEHVT